MKRKLTAFLCAAAMLMTLLAGCGSAAPETAQINSKDATEEPTTAPTEPKTFFEEQGLTLWEGFKVEENPDVREICGTRDCSNGFNVVFYEKGDTVEEIFRQEVVATSVDLHICKYYAEDFGMKNIANVVDSFYRADLADNPDLSKEQWLNNHQDDMILNCWCVTNSATSEAADRFFAGSEDGNYGWHIFGEGLSLLDRETGTVFSPPDSQEVGKFSLNRKGETVTFSAVDHWMFTLVDTKTSDNPDVVYLGDMYVLIPREQNDLIFMLGLINGDQPDDYLIQLINDEEDEEDTAWHQRSYQEYVEEFGYVEPCFAAMD